jgi:hypothetical protein
MLVAKKVLSPKQALANQMQTEQSSSTPTVLVPVLDYPKPLSVFERIAKCESQNNPLARNPNSTASGKYQFLKSSWEHYGKQLWGDNLKNHDVFDETDNTILAAYVYGKSGTSDWLPSKFCWQV